MIGIRRATKKDQDTIATFNRQMAMETEGKELDAATVAKGVAEVFHIPEKGFYLLAESNGDAVGQLMITREWSDWRNGNFWWIQSVYVRPEFRRKSVYRRLHSEVIKMAKAEGSVRGIRLYVDTSNEKAQQAYLSLGMKKSHYIMMEDEFESGS